MAIETDETVMIPLLLPFVLAVIVHFMRRERRAEERARGTYRAPVMQVAAVGWFPLAIGIYFLVSSTITFMTHGPDPAEGSSPEFEVLVGAPFFLVGAAMTVSLARRRIAVWGEHLRYRPHFAAERSIWAMEAVRAELMTTRQEVKTFWVTGRNGRKAYWEISAFPPRTITAFRHGVHHNDVEGATVVTPIHGIDEFSGDEMLQMPDGTVATWHPSRTVQLDVLISTTHEHLLSAVENRLATVLAPLPGARRDGHTGDDAHEGSVYRAHIEWRRRPGTTAIDARIRAGDDKGLSDAGLAYSWLRSQLVQGARKHLSASDTPRPQRERLADVFTITYQETWT